MMTNAIILANSINMPKQMLLRECACLARFVRAVYVANHELKVGDNSGKFQT